MEKAQRDIELTEAERQEAQQRSSTTAHVVHAAVRQEGEHELQRTSAGLAWSGLAAGLSMGFSLMVEGALHAHLPDKSWSEIISKAGYSAGFVIVILGRQQLSTENTSTPIAIAAPARQSDGAECRAVMDNVPLTNHPTWNME
jgi:formate/nitrite transporter FocA (FNT family)